MKLLAVALFAALLGTSGVAMADWGNGQDIADQWGDGSNAFGGSGNPYGGGYHGTIPYRHRQNPFFGRHYGHRYAPHAPIIRHRHHR